MFNTQRNEFIDVRDYFLLELSRKIVRVNKFNLVKISLLAVGQVYKITDLTFDHIVTPRKPMSTEAKPRLNLVFEG